MYPISARVLIFAALFSATAWAEDSMATQGVTEAATIIIPENTSTDAAVADPADADRVMRAIALVGSPYKMGGASPETGFDCSGLVAYVFRETVGYTLPRSADGLFRMNDADHVQIVERTELATGDLVFFSIGRLGKRIDHVGIVLGDGRFLHAPSRGGVVRMDSLELPYWKKHYAGARRLPHSLMMTESPIKNEDSLANTATSFVRADNHAQ